MPLMQGPILLQTLECYKPWALMAEKKYTDEYGATTATSLRNKQHIIQKTQNCYNSNDEIWSLF